MPIIITLDISKKFPNLTDYNHSITSPADLKYNCIAWAAGLNKKWCDPNPQVINGYWPNGVPRTNDFKSFVEFFKSLGFSRCDDGQFEIDYEKIAIYSLFGIFKHVAKLISEDCWSSKLGASHDVTHTLDALNGPFYGSVSIFMKRKTKN